MVDQHGVEKLLQRKRGQLPKDSPGAFIIKLPERDVDNGSAPSEFAAAAKGVRQYLTTTQGITSVVLYTPYAIRRRAGERMEHRAKYYQVAEIFNQNHRYGEGEFRLIRTTGGVRQKDTGWFDIINLSAEAMKRVRVVALPPR